MLDNILTPINEPMTIDGGDGNDILAGGWGDDTIRGGVGNDTIEAGGGDDIVLGGTGDDRFRWQSRFVFPPSDGNDIIDGELGTDTLEVHGLSDPEVFVLAPSGQRAVLTKASRASPSASAPPSASTSTCWRATTTSTRWPEW